MRKPLVVLGVAAAALVAGGVVTTRALAQEPPDDQFSGFNVFGEPLFVDGGGEGDEYEEEPVAESPHSDVADEPETPDVTPSREAPEPARTPSKAATREPGERPEPPVRLKAPVQRKDAGAAPAAVAAAVADPIAASRTEVTVDSISSSPSAPVQQQILALVNRYRERSGCRPVTLDRRLIDAANRHAADMARRDYFEHASPNGDRAGDRVSEAGYDWRWYGENIARGQDSPWDAMDGWMNSPEHRENILDCKLDQMGVGLALDRDHTPYWVQDFATPK
ncbi:hypothetical protein GCM10010168_30700 [Actinoplanes ianthinogenes]|uniref:SCP domain-containing protein n=1 Tax=Actinoplanes ianthinogenes TaxID=122358 RepID=A0ABM7LLX1_9ACTN|nr:CAP domain-containing protein [Actinoplanes ianthinogenes]BCJ40212.1 hypothetical protein Aiant_08690 [Actinoplanes ianthinogenes]GGR11007.1 hypothetical protein GCM10010168_30700 [Actinoplanes ianthinogenes]